MMLEIISDTESEISSIKDKDSTLSDDTITPSNININEINLFPSYHTGELIFYSSNKNHLGIKNSVSNVIAYNEETITSLHKKLSGIKNFNYEPEIYENISINESNRVLCNLDLLYASLLPKKGLKPSVWKKDDTSGVPLITKDDYLKLMLQGEYYPIRDSILIAYL